MAENPDSRESDNNSWVIAGSEALPVEDLGLETSEETQAHSEELQDEAQGPLDESKPLLDHLSLDEAKLKIQGPEVVLDPKNEELLNPAKDPQLTLLSSQRMKEPGTSDGKEGPISVPQGTLFIHKAGPLGKEGNSSSEEESATEHDVEGLRRRKVRETHAVPFGDGQDRGGETLANEDGGFPKTKWLFGFLALVGFGLLAFLGVAFDPDEGPVDILSTWSSSDGEEQHPGIRGKHGWPPSSSLDPPGDAELRQAKEALLSSEPPGDPQSLDTMGHLLDKLAKENQDIRLMQAELQAQKEELQALLHKTEGEALAFDSQQQSLAADNSKLKETLQQERSFLLAAQAELSQLRGKLQGLSEEGHGKPRQHSEVEPAPDHHHSKAEHPETEIRRLRSLLALIRRDLGKVSAKIPPGKEAEGLRMELDGVEQRLARELEGEEGAKLSWKEGHKGRRSKEKTWHRRYNSQHHADSLRKSHHLPQKSPKTVDNGAHRPRKHQGPRDAKPSKDSAHHLEGRKAKKPAEPRVLWETLAKQQYPLPQGCVGVAECAQQEGLEPVQKSHFLPMVQSYLVGVGWTEYYEDLAAALEGYFGSDGSFAHDRLSFVEFLDEVEDALEELAEYLGGSEEEADNFEEVVLRQLGSAPRGRFTHRDSAQRHAKSQNPEGHSRKNDRENSSSHG